MLMQHILCLPHCLVCSVCLVMTKHYSVFSHYLINSTANGKKHIVTVGALHLYVDTLVVLPVVKCSSPHIIALSVHRACMFHQFI